MSAGSSTAEHSHVQHAHDADHAVHGGAAHGSFKGYVTGFVLSVILTAIPFWLVMADVLGDNAHTTIVILALGVAQIFVHMVYFLHLNTKSEGGWTVLALIFTLTLLIIMLTGSIWVMHHLNTNMMPMGPHDLLHHQP